MDAQTFEILKILLDKGLIGGAIGLGAYIGAVALERHRARNALVVEISKRRASAVARCWRDLMRYFDAVRQYEIDTQLKDEMSEVRKERAPEDLKLAHRTQLRTMHRLMVERTWLDPDLYSDLTLLYDTMTDLLAALVRGDPEEVRQDHNRLTALFKETEISRAIDALLPGSARARGRFPGPALRSKSKT